MDQFCHVRASTLHYYLFVDVFIEYYAAQVGNLVCGYATNEKERKRQRAVY